MLHSDATLCETGVPHIYLIWIVIDREYAPLQQGGAPEGLDPKRHIWVLREGDRQDHRHRQWRQGGMIYMTSAKIMQSPSGQEISLDFFFYPCPSVSADIIDSCPPPPAPTRRCRRPSTTRGCSGRRTSMRNRRGEWPDRQMGQVVEFNTTFKVWVLSSSTSASAWTPPLHIHYAASFTKFITMPTMKQFPPFMCPLLVK